MHQKGGLQTVLPVRLLLCNVLLCCVFPAVGQTDSLARYIDEALRHHPSLAAQYQRYESMVAGAEGAGQLPDPTFSATFFPDPMHQLGGKQVATFSLMQRFPWWGSLKAERLQQIHLSEAAYEQFRAAALDLSYDIVRQWQNILALHEQEKSVARQITVLNELQSVALYHYTAGEQGKNDRLSDRLRIESELEKLKEQAQSLNSRCKLAYQQFNLSLHRPALSPLSFPDTLLLDSFPILTSEQIMVSDPQLASLQAQYLAYGAQKAKAKAQGLPTIGIGVEYMLNSKVSAPMMPSMNGKDMVMPMLTVSLPIYRKRYKAETHRAQLLQDAVQSSMAAQRDRLTASFLEIKQAREDVLRKMALYDTRLDLLNRSLSLMQAEYVNGQSSLTDIFQLLREEIDLLLKKAEAYARHNILAAQALRLLATQKAPYPDNKQK